MEATVKERTVTRRQFTRTGNELDAIMNTYSTEFDNELISLITSYKKVKEIAEKLMALDIKIKNYILNAETWDEAILERELEESEKYRSKWISLETRYEMLDRVNPSIDITHTKPKDTTSIQTQRHFKLPILEFKKFDGNLKNWLPFWGQFKKIHDDSNIDDDDKLQYLQQSMQSGTEVNEFINSLSACSYKDCLEQLKSRYARDDLLIQVYVRELLQMVLLKDTASWWGGFWERLIRIMKDLLRRILGKSRVSYEELETILCECEAIMNGRPLTYVQDDKNICLEPLTPANFIQCISQTDTTDLDQIDATKLNQRLKYLQNLREDFKTRFKSEYLTALVSRGKEIKVELKVGDVVLIETEDKRVKWPLGLIVAIYPGKDSVSRTAQVKTSSGCKIRPFQRLYRLEVSAAEIEELFRINKGLESEGKDINIKLKEKTLDEVSTEGERTTKYGRVIRMPSKYKL